MLRTKSLSTRSLSTRGCADPAFLLAGSSPERRRWPPVRKELAHRARGPFVEIRDPSRDAPQPAALPHHLHPPLAILDGGAEQEAVGIIDPVATVLIGAPAHRQLGSRPTWKAHVPISRRPAR